MTCGASKMTLDLIVQAILNGLTIGAIYSLLALGLTLLFGIMDILFFAHGALYMFGAYAAYYLVVKFGVNYILAALISMAAVGLLGTIIEKALIRPVRGEILTVFFVAISLNWFLENSGFAMFGIKPKRIPQVFEGKVEFLGASLTWERIIVVLIGLAAVLALHVFLTRTRWGLGMRAFSEDPEAAELQGISNDFVCSLGFFIGSGLAALAGLLVASLFIITPTMGEHAVLTGILIIALGGLGSVPGALIAALILGFIESFAGTFVGADYTWGPMFMFCFIFLIIRPTGIMGVER
jgi:branched-chain amino acid transport system permease protein